MSATDCIDRPRRAATPAYGFHPAEVRRALERILAPGQVTELRVIDALVDGDRRPQTFAGWFDSDHIDNLIRDLERVTFAPAVYFIANSIDPDLLGRRCNFAEVSRGSKQMPTTSDDNIIERKWLLIDIDVKRATAISATDDEKQLALEVATSIDHDLWSRGYPPGLIGDSGNGCHVMVPFEVPIRCKSDDLKAANFHKQLLLDLAQKHGMERKLPSGKVIRATVDEVTFNASRLWKLPGTLVCKGSHAPEIGRVWRLSKVLTFCQESE